MNNSANSMFAIHAELHALCEAYADLSLIRDAQDLNSENVQIIRALAAAAAAAVATHGDVTDLL